MCTFDRLFKHLVSFITGTFAVVSLMVANGIVHVLESNEEMYPCLNGTDNNDVLVNISGTEMSCEELKVKIAVTLSFLSGIFMVREIILIT